MKRYDKLFITLDEEDMVKLKSDGLIGIDGMDDIPPIIICTEKGYNNFLEFWERPTMKVEVSSFIKK